MSSLRISKIFTALPEAVKRLGSYAFDSNQALVWNSPVASSAPAYAGNDSAVVDIDGATWASGHRRAVLVSLPSSDANNTPALKTQSHAAGQIIVGSSAFAMYCEAPAAFGNAQDYFERLVNFHLQGQMAAPVLLYFCANGTEPTVQGVNGASSTATFSSPIYMTPYGGAIGYAGGV